jgi:hypothetical protein
MSEPIRAFKSGIYRPPGVTGQPNEKESASPATDLDKFLDALFHQFTDLECTPFPGPTKPIHSAKVKP